MQLLDIVEAGHRLHLGALEAPHGLGFTAALAVQRVSAPAGAPPLFRDDLLACGHRFATADDALAFALRRGRAWLRARSAGPAREQAELTDDTSTSLSAD